MENDYVGVSFTCLVNRSTLPFNDDDDLGDIVYAMQSGQNPNGIAEHDRWILAGAIGLENPSTEFVWVLFFNTTRKIAHSIASSSVPLHLRALLKGKSSSTRICDTPLEMTDAMMAGAHDQAWLQRSVDRQRYVSEAVFSSE